MDDREKAIEYIIERLLEGRREIDKLKKEAAVIFRPAKMIRNSEIFMRGRERLPPDVARLLLKKPTRTASGVTPIAIMVRPDGSCSHGCIYCPFTGKAAKSYTGKEPAALRAVQADFEPDRQVESRLKQYEEMGHPTDKCEMIIMGGTFLEMPAGYKRDFIKRAYDALNGTASQGLEEAVRNNENAAHRAIGLTIETRPDVCGKKEIDEMLEYGATRVELGVQHPDDEIYGKIGRGHKVGHVVEATRLLKNCAFKVLYHIMPGIPGSNPEKDIEMMKMLFSDERFRPDMLKIYPTLVVDGTVLNEMVKRGEYAPYSSEEAADVISEFYRHIPEYVRVMRIQRDIPANLILSGVKKSNLRELVHRKIEEKGIKSGEMRSREVGITKSGYDAESFSIKRLDYAASGGKEAFLSCENGDGIIAGFLRLRINGPESHREEIGENCALVRELHVYGSEAVIGKSGEVQHRGIGKTLLETAERIAKDDFGKEKIVIISGVGAREYYFWQGYERLGRYLAKRL
ncbi:tRNA uridine(34) 5-carboxymethylaminomethyl modification radical SAM/GNAT enzyme Elp3 [Candidatus Micrarchaeota archaeon]|nr:tRNA uridine(34) 5-carboxymethylaminomethyl modification radical SAM/GNAT enzyme Elp3 [Candidatus Micrarchaeota archaeon]